MFLNSSKKSECCGCTACENVCSKKAITMLADERGFLYPEIDQILCVNCKQCENVCQFYKTELWDNTVISAYGMHHKNLSVRRTSRSGGAFYMLAQAIIELNGSVFGAAFDSKLNVVHIEVKTISELEKLQGSKYVQSYLGNSFAIVANELKNKKYVLFSGTACQVAGLLSYLNLRNCDTNTLITCDIICQGVPSPSLYCDYKKYLEKKHKSTLVNFNFRDASRIGWKGHEESYNFKKSKKKYYSRKYANYYYYYYMRESCFECKYTGLHRPADFSLGDFWGIENNYPDFVDSDGNSIILVNTEKGELFFESAKKYGDILKVDVSKCLQPRLVSPSVKPDKYELFWEEYKILGYEYCIKKYGKESIKSKLVYTLKPLIRKIKSWSKK